MAYEKEKETKNVLSLIWEGLKVWELLRVGISL